MTSSPPHSRSLVLPVGPDPRLSPAIAQAAQLLQRGELVVFATETVYGLGARADDVAAVQRIYQVKGRPSNNPLIVHVADQSQARRWAARWPPSAQRLAKSFWPGPLTLVVPADERLPPIVRAGRATIALRVPSHPVAQALLRASGLPLAAPSANRSGHISPTCAEHVLRSLKNPVALILDSGPTPLGVESTVVDLTGVHPRLLRPGAITLADLSRVIGAVETLRPENQEEDLQAALPSPGMMRRHYAPAARIYLFDLEEWTTVMDQIVQRQSKLEKVGVLSFSGRAQPDATAPQKTKPKLQHTPEHPVPLPSGVQGIFLPHDPAPYAAQLYAALHELEEAGCTWLAIESPPDEPAWHAVLDRLTRAAADA